MIEERKKRNAYYDMMNADIADRKRVQQVATFEINTTKRIEKNMKEVCVLCIFFTSQHILCGML